MLRLALVGCGDHGRRGHLEAYRQLIAVGERLQVVALVDPNPAHLAAAAELAPEAHPFSDYATMLAEARPDAVALATPPLVHREQAVAAFEAGAHVLCEKPLARSLAEARDIVRAAARAGRVLAMGLQLRHQRQTRFIRETIASGTLGTVFYTRVWAGHTWRLPPSPHFLSQELGGGGVVAATAVHIIDATLWMLGNPTLRTISASGFAKAPRLDGPPPPFDTWDDGAAIVAGSTVEDFATALFRFADGSALSLETTWLAHPGERHGSTRFLATGGVIEMHPLRVAHDRAGVVEDRTPADVSDDPERHYYLDVARDFVAAARDGTPSIVRPREMLQTQAAIDAIYASIAAGREVEVAPID